MTFPIKDIYSVYFMCKGCSNVNKYLRKVLYNSHVKTLPNLVKVSLVKRSLKKTDNIGHW